MNVIITRPLMNSEDLMGKLFSLGHKIIHVPTLQILPADVAPINPDKYEAYIFTEVQTQLEILNWKKWIKKNFVFVLGL